MFYTGKRNFFCIIIFFLVTYNSFAGKVLKDKNESLKIDFYLLESEFEDGKYLDDDFSGFKEYNRDYLLREKNLQRRMYTFKGEFYLDENLKDFLISAYLSPNDYPYNLYLNGKKIFFRGRYKDGYNSTIYRTSNVVFPEYLLNYGSEKNIFVLQAFPLSEETPLEDIYISSAKKNATKVFLRNLYNVQFIHGAFVLAIILFLYFLFVFGAEQLKDLKYLYYSLMCLFFALSYFNIFFYNDFIDEVILEKVSRASFPMSTLFIGLFIIEYTKIFKKINWRKIFFYCITIIPNLLASLVLLFQNTKKDIHAVFDGFSSYVSIASILITFIFLIISSIYLFRKEKQVWPLFINIGFLVTVCTIVIDATSALRGVVPYIWTISYGFLALVITIFFILSIEQSILRVDSEIKAVQLKDKNLSLNRMMRNISMVSKSLINTSNKLGTNVRNTVDVIKLFGATNKEIMDKITNQLGYIEIMINQVANRIDMSRERIPKAISNQTESVRNVNRTISKMNSHIEATSGSVMESSNVANELAVLADESSKIVIKSKESIDEISQSSNFINELLNSVVDITEKTNLLSINASIEAANRGEIGKGFIIIAHEIRNLALKSQNSLNQSFENINNMVELIEESTNLSNEVSKRLLRIINEAKNSAAKINHITELINDQKLLSAKILAAAENLFHETNNIKVLSDEDQEDNQKIKKTLLDLKVSYSSVTSLLNQQYSNEKELYNSIEDIKAILSETLKNVDILNDSIKKNT